MTTYYFVLLLTLLLSFFAKHLHQYSIDAIRGKAIISTTWKTRNLFVWILAAMLISVAAFRYNVGTDWVSYYFVRYINSYIKGLSTNFWMEPGTGILASIANIFYSGDGSFVFIAAVVTIGLFVRTIAKYSDMFILSMLLYILLGCWHGSFNGVRQYLAAAVLFAGHRYIIDRKFLKWLIVVIIAGLFHTTAYVMLFWYFVAARKLDRKQITLVLVITAVAYFSYDSFFALIEAYKGKEMLMTDTYLTSDVNLLRIIVHWVPFIFYLVFIEKVKMDKEMNFYINMALLDAALMTAAMGSTYLARVGIYTVSFQLLAWPKLLKCINVRDRRIILVFMTVFYFIYWYKEASSRDLETFQWVFAHN